MHAITSMSKWLSAAQALQISEIHLTCPTVGKEWHINKNLNDLTFARAPRWAPKTASLPLCQNESIF